MKTKHLISSVVILLAGLPVCSPAQSLGSAASFAALGTSTVTSTGGTILTGDLGVYPGTTTTGFGAGSVIGTIYDGVPVAQQAEADAQTAYAALYNEVPGLPTLTGTDLGGLILSPGVYNFTSSAQLTGTLTLNALDDPNALFVFQIGSTLTTAVDAAVVLENEAQAGNVYWQVGSSATIGVGTTMAGSILAFSSITLNNGASLDGNALALNGAVTLDDNSITVTAIPEPSASWLFLLGALGFGARYCAKNFTVAVQIPAAVKITTH
jgi:type VI secretion system secreted protein VgrG